MRLLLIRHGHTAALAGRTLAGRAPGLGLSAEGRREVARLAEGLATLPLAAVHASPMARTLETAALVARPHRLPVQLAPGAVEVDFGLWTGRDYTTFGEDAAWRAWHAARGIAGTPGGERFVAVQARVVEAMLALADAHPGDALVALVSHADVIRAALGYVLGVPPELQLRLEISPASVSTIELAPWGGRVLQVNAAASSLQFGT